MKKIIIMMMLSILAVPAFSETQATQQSTTAQPTTTQAPAPSQDAKTQETTKEPNTSIIDFCRTHTC